MHSSRSEIGPERRWVNRLPGCGHGIAMPSAKSGKGVVAANPIAKKRLTRARALLQSYARFRKSWEPPVATARGNQKLCLMAVLFVSSTDP
jgi:hypothetical protein